MKINLKQPKYVLPMIALPFLCLFFYVWHSSFAKNKTDYRPAPGLNGNVGTVSSDVRRKSLSDKLDAYRNAFKGGGGLTAVNSISQETSGDTTFKDNYSSREKKTLDSIDRAMKLKYGQPKGFGHDQALASSLNAMPKPRAKPIVVAEREKDPMDIFKQQMTYIDSVNRQNDPAVKAEKAKKEALAKALNDKAQEIRLTVSKASDASSDFNTVRPHAANNFITAVIDENVTGYAGSRLRLRLLEDIKAGPDLIRKGTYLYALVNGFSEQRVTLVITSILSDGKILPVKLDVYDLDGMPGLYVPSSAFRDFTKNLGGNAVQGVTIDGSSGGSQFIMSSLDKVFQSTSSAIADLVRKNKAKLKYNSYLYLIDNDALQHAQKSY